MGDWKTDFAIGSAETINDGRIMERDLTIAHDANCRAHLAVVRAARSMGESEEIIIAYLLGLGDNRNCSIAFNEWKEASRAGNS